MRLKTLALSALLLSPSAAFALDVEKAGELEALMEEKRAEVAKEFGNKKPNEMSASERRAYYEKIEAGNREVLQKNGVSDKEYARSTAKMGRGSQKAIEEAKKSFQEKRAAEEKAKAEKAKGSGEVKIQRGFDDKNPVDLEGDSESGPEIQRGGGKDGIQMY